MKNQGSFIKIVISALVNYAKSHCTVIFQKIFAKRVDIFTVIAYNTSDESYPLAFISVADTLGARQK